MLICRAWMLSLLLSIWPIEFLRPYGLSLVNSLTLQRLKQNLENCCCSRVRFCPSQQTLSDSEGQSEVKPLQNRWLKSAQLKGVNTVFILPGTQSSTCVLQKAHSDSRVQSWMSLAWVITLLLQVNLYLYFLCAGPYVNSRRKPKTKRGALNTYPMSCCR